ncbi:hypothetical protein ACQEV2_43005 [Streptomyces sp. CA-251387]|uniref:hypothetical protein n=1 Tax=Streptomyces sp. CA-251387 TaxID=3240064 RepID=UPI003D8ECFD8
MRFTKHILDVLVLHRDRLALRIHDGTFSTMDLTARHPRTGKLLSTVKFMAQTLAAAGERRDPQRELTYDRLRAAEAKGNKGNRLKKAMVDQRFKGEAIIHARDRLRRQPHPQPLPLNNQGGPLN